MAATSAGLLLYRFDGHGALEVLLVHPGGPYWANQDDGAWSIPKGEHGPDEDPYRTAVREFAEELGTPPPTGAGTDLDLGSVTQAGGKQVRCWARAADFDTTSWVSNTFELEWPPRSGQTRTFPEVDQAVWHPLDVARRKLNPAQVTFVDRLEAQRVAR